MAKHLYFAACTADGGIYHYILENEQLIFADKTACDRPMYLDVKDHSMQVILRAPFEGNEPWGTSGLLEYPIGEDGKLGMPGEMQSTLGAVACHLCRYQDRIYVANYISGSVYSSEGKVKEHIGNGPHPTRQDAPHLHFVQPSPDGKCLFAVDLGTDSIYSYDADLNLLSTAQVPSGCGARHLAYSEDGKYVFCVNELASSVSVFAYEDTKLILLQTVNALKEENPNSTAAAIRVKGDYVYVSNRGADSISCLEWDGKELILRSETPCGGGSPRDFLIVEDLLFATNEKSNNVTVLRVNGPEMQKLDQELEMPGPLCVVMLEV